MTTNFELSDLRKNLSLVSSKIKIISQIKIELFVCLKFVACLFQFSSYGCFSQFLKLQRKLVFTISQSAFGHRHHHPHHCQHHHHHHPRHDHHHIHIAKIDTVSTTAKVTFL